MEDATPIEIDPEVMDVMNTSIRTTDFEKWERDRPEMVWSDKADPRTVDDLIEALKEFRDTVGGDAEVRSAEAGHHIHVRAREYEDGTGVVRM